jgi:hypothetical protein
MNWYKIYSSIIEKAKIRGKEEYTENHHIIPKCLGGNNSKENLVRLTGREHFIAHKILTLLYPDSKSLKFALWAMCNQKGKYRKYNVTSRDYEQARQACMPLWKQPKTEEHKSNLSKAKVGKKINRNQKGKNNHNYNKIWITNTDTQESKMILATEVIVAPWVKGRVKVGVLGTPQTKGRRWFSNKTTNVEKLYEPGKQPEGWTKGRLRKAVH